MGRTPPCGWQIGVLKHPLPYIQESSYVPTVSPTVEVVDYPIPGYGWQIELLKRMGLVADRQLKLAFVWLVDRRAETGDRGARPEGEDPRQEDRRSPEQGPPTGGLVFKAHRLLYHSTLDLRVIKKKKEPLRCVPS